MIGDRRRSYPFVGADRLSTGEGRRVGLLIVLLGGTTEVSLGPDGAARLAALGVTNVALLKDEDALAFVLEGWAFDPGRSGSEAKAIVSGGEGTARTLFQVMGMAISRGATQPDPPSETSDGDRGERDGLLGASVHIEMAEGC